MGLFNKKRKKTNVEIYIDFLEELFGGEPHDIHSSDAEDGGPPVSVLIWYDIPEEGYKTAVTYGLSERDHPKWKYGKPELIISCIRKTGIGELQWLYLLTCSQVKKHLHMVQFLQQMFP